MTAKLSNLHGDQHIIWLASLTCLFKIPFLQLLRELAAIKNGRVLHQVRSKQRWITLFINLLIDHS